MHFMMAALIGLLYAAGLFMMMRRSMVKMIIGLVLLGHAANLLIFTAASITRSAPPLLGEGGAVLRSPLADPLPHALILTAIVIGLAVLGFTIVLIHRVYESTGSDDLDQLQATE